MTDLGANANTLWASCFVNALANCGVTDVCTAPGSRSTPLTLAFAAADGITLHRHLDERSAAYFALGLALYRRRPVALVCTSGTAAANFFPAVIEARYSRVPLLVLTADRPPELRDSGANQTIDQVKLYGDHVLWAHEIPVPVGSPSEMMQRYLRTTAARACAVASGIPSGPVHLNFPFRKPLEPTPGHEVLYVGEEANLRAMSSAKTFTRGHMAPTPDDVNDLAELIRSEPHGLIVCGPRCPGGAFRDAVVSLSEAAGYPILADALSGLRFGAAAESGRVLGSYGLRLSGNGHNYPVPKVVIRFGAVPTSSALNAFLETVAPDQYVHVSEDGEWADDAFLVNRLVQAEPSALCNQVVASLTESRHEPDDAWSSRFPAIEAETRQLVAGLVGRAALTDFVAVTRALDSAPDNAIIFAGNSLPVRHIDAFAQPSRRSLEVHANRGASGIDGNVSTALGLAAASGRPVIAILGDITFYHDMNGLLATRSASGLDVTFIVLNNDGGGLFHRLPIARLDPPFTELFLTPHGLTFEHTAALYGLDYRSVDNVASLDAALKWAFDRDNEPRTEARMIEVRTDSRADYDSYRDLLGTLGRTHAQEVHAQ